MSWIEEDFGDDYNDDGEDTTMDCPYCGKAICDDTEWCPHCNNYLSREDAPLRVPTWILIGVVVCLAVVFSWIFGMW